MRETVTVTITPTEYGDADPDELAEAMWEAAHEVIRESNPERCFECEPTYGAEECHYKDHWIDPDAERDAWLDRKFEDA